MQDISRNCAVLFGHGSKELLFNDFGKANNGAQRRAQFVQQLLDVFRIMRVAFRYVRDFSEIGATQYPAIAVEPPTGSFKKRRSVDPPIPRNRGRAAEAHAGIFKRHFLAKGSGAICIWSGPRVKGGFRDIHADNRPRRRALNPANGAMLVGFEAYLVNRFGKGNGLFDRSLGRYFSRLMLFPRNPQFFDALNNVPDLQNLWCRRGRLSLAFVASGRVICRRQ